MRKVTTNFSISSIPACLLQLKAHSRGVNTLSVTSFLELKMSCQFQEGSNRDKTPIAIKE